MVVKPRWSGLRSKAASPVCVWVAGHHHVFRAKPQVVDGLWTNHGQSLWFSWFPQGQPVSSALRDTVSSPAPAQRGGSPPLMPGVEREAATIHVTLDLLIDRWFDDFTYWKWWYSIAATAMECDPTYPCGDPWDPTTGLVWSATGSTNRGIKRKKTPGTMFFKRCFTMLYPPLPVLTHQAKGSPKLILSPCSTTFQADNDSSTSGQPVETYRQSTCAAVQTEQPGNTNNEQPKEQQKKHIIS